MPVWLKIKRESGGLTMALLKWDDSYSVNVREIDQQHQQLIRMLNEFYAHIEQDSKGAFRTLLDSLVDYTQYHFSTEEKYFAQYGYPDADAHIQTHKNFTGKVLDVRERLLNGQMVLSVEITSFLKNWLTDHIKGADKAYGRHFNEHGLY